MSFEICNSGNSNAVDIENFCKIFVDEKDYCIKAASLHSFVKSFLHSTEEDNLETRRNLSFELILKIPNLFAALTHFENSAKYDEAKEIKILNLESAMLCLETLLLYQENFKRNEQLLSILQVTLKILYQAYTHCKDSETLYGDFLEDFTDQLACFFQKIQDIQTNMIMGFDQLVINDISITDESVILSICDDLGKLCELVSRLDAMIAAKLWRIFIKIISHFSRIVHIGLEAETILSTLISIIIDIICEFKHRIESKEKVEESNIKFFLFQINLIMKIFHVFLGNLDKSIQKLQMLVFELYNLLVMIYSSSEGEEGNEYPLKKALISSFSPMMSLFYTDNSFLTSALEFVSNESSSSYHLSYLFLKVTALNHLNSNKDPNYLSPYQKREILKNLFKVLQKNKPEDDLKFNNLQLPKSLFHSPESSGQDNERSLTLYTEFYLSLSEFSKLIPDSEFTKLVNEMIEFLASSSEMVSLLISDIWMYRLRCSSIEYLYISCINLSHTAFKMDSNIYVKLHFKRMLNFLPYDKKLALFDSCKDIKSIHYYFHKVIHRYGIPNSNLPENQIDISGDIKKISHLMNELKISTSKDDQNLIKKACNILELLSYLVSVSENNEILKFTELASSFFKTEIFEVQIAVLTFLKAIRKKHLEENSADFKRIVSCISALLAEVLKSRNYIVRQEAFRTYISLAYSTPHHEIVQGTTATAPELVHVIKSYVMKEPLSGFLTEKERFKILQTQLQSSMIFEEAQLVLSEECKRILFGL